MPHGYRLIDHGRRRLLATTFSLIPGLELAMLGMKKKTQPGVADGFLGALRGATTWLNTAPLTEAGLRGKVVLVDFCTYTCINWLRQLPYVRAWDEKYRDRGLVVIGVHTPEFSFEQDLDNVRRSIAALRVSYPVAVDNDYAIWNGFRNRYWPAIYCFDAEGEVRHREFGEGGYEETEREIQGLLARAGGRPVGRELVVVSGRGVEAEADWGNLRSAENYLGSDRTRGFVDQRDGARLELNEWSIAGDWTRGRHSVRLRAAGGRLRTRFHSRDVHLVMGPARRGNAVRYRVYVDGQAPGSAHGADMDETGAGLAGEQRLYQLVRQPGRIVDRLLEIEFLDPDVEAFAFTFG